MTHVPTLPAHCRAVVAVPACNEAERIGSCLAALATQRGPTGVPVASGSFAVLVFANSCTDNTATQARIWAPLCPFPLTVVEELLPPGRRNAGWARKRAMDIAADWLGPRRDGILFTTDADSRVGSTWIERTLDEIAAGADAVAGYIEAEPTELLEIGSAFLERGRLEDSYLALTAEIASLCDPLRHDAWPNHRVNSGASFAVTIAAYRAIGGVPPIPLGEDAALAAALLEASFKIRHSMDVVVTTSCRLDGRASGGAADTMRQRRDQPDAPCDADIESARAVLRRFAWKGRLRAWHALPAGKPWWAGRLQLEPTAMPALRRCAGGFETFWRAVERDSPILRRNPPLRPSDLPAEIARAHRAVLRLQRITRALAPGERPR